MINSLIELAGQYSPAFIFVNDSWPYILSCFFIAIAFSIKNKYVLLVVLENLLFIFAHKFLLESNPFLFLAVSILIYCSFIYIFSRLKFAFVSLCYILSALTVMSIYFIDSNLEIKSLSYDVSGTVDDYLIYESAYQLKEFSFYVYNIAVVPIINLLIVTGFVLVKGGGRGYNNNDRLVDFYGLRNNSGIHRLKRNFKRIIQRVQKA